MPPITFARRAQKSARRAAPTRAAVLGNMAVAAFLRRHWQKSPLLLRAALPGFDGLYTLADLVALAAREEVESRLVQRRGSRWSLTHGPFEPRSLRRLPKRDWTLLVQGVNLHDPAADALLRRFDFLPYARLDDLMVSYAAPGGGVGPHLDAYDVFLLQGFGRRRWRYGAPSDASFRPGLPLRILRRFTPTDDAVLAAGDLLYLPPQYAHDGVALDACTTYSIGFRAPSATELGAAFLTFLQDDLALAGRYADADLRPTGEPARLDDAMLRAVVRMLRDVRWTRHDVARFLGAWLTEPKANVFFERRSPVPPAAFGARARRDGVRLDPKSQVLYDDERLFVNGAVHAWPRAGRALLRRLANARNLGAAELRRAPPALLDSLHDWHADGYLHLGSG